LELERGTVCLRPGKEREKQLFRKRPGLDGDWTAKIFPSDTSLLTPLKGVAKPGESNTTNYENTKTDNQSQMNPPIRTAIKPIVPPKIVPKIAAPIVTPVEPVSALPVPTKTKTVPCVVGVFLEVASDEREGLGAAFLRVSRDAGTREIGISLFHDRLIVGRSIAKSDELALRFLGSILLVEMLYCSRVSGNAEMREVMTGLKAMLGGPWEFGANLSFLATQLAKHEATSLGKLLESPKSVIPWFQIPYQGPAKSAFWQWNSAILKPERPAKKAEGGLK
jgi:hypothetical protein